MRVGNEAASQVQYHPEWITFGWSGWGVGAQNFVSPGGQHKATFGIGGLSRHGPDLTRPVGPIHWACTDIAGVGHMHMEGAIRSGRAAARAVLSQG